MEYDHIWDVVVPILLTVLLLVLVFTIAVCKYKKCMNMGKDVALRRHRKLWMTCGSLNNSGGYGLLYMVMINVPIYSISVKVFFIHHVHVWH